MKRVYGIPIERTEIYQWNNDTKKIKEVENRLKSKDYNQKEEYFELFSKIDDVFRRSSLSGRGKYHERMIICRELQKVILSEATVTKEK